jgi:hypothetical protein
MGRGLLPALGFNPCCLGSGCSAVRGRMRDDTCGLGNLLGHAEVGGRGLAAPLHLQLRSKHVGGRGSHETSHCTFPPPHRAAMPSDVTQLPENRTLNADGWLLLATRCIRLFAYGFQSVVLVLYHKSIGLNDERVGLLLTLTLLGDTAISLWITTTADRVGRHQDRLRSAAVSQLRHPQAARRSCQVTANPRNTGGSITFRRHGVVHERLLWMATNAAHKSSRT